MRFISWLSAATVVSGFAVLATGCALGGADEEEVGEGQQAQIDPGIKDYVVYSIHDALGLLKGKVLVTATSGSGYTANREYWYMAANLSNSGTYTFTGGTAKYWHEPPDPDLVTLSFVTNRTPTWTSGTPSGTMLNYSSAFAPEKISINWGMTVSGGTWSGSITWWHSNTNNIFGAGSSKTLSSGTPSSGTWYYYTTSPL